MKTVTTKQLEEFFKAVNELTPARKTQFIQKMEELAKKLTLGNGDTIDGFIYKTVDINQFLNVDGNRIINEESGYVRELAESISEIGNVAPVIVNEKNETIDGQRRIAAVRKYGLPNPIRYTRVDGADIKTVGEVNRLQQTWTYKDWLHKYVTIGNKDYIEYKDIEDRFSKYIRPRSLRSLLMHNRIEAFKSDIWEHGNFKINREVMDDAIRFLSLLERVYEIGAEDNIFAKNRNFQRALHDVFKTTPKLDEARLLKKVKLNFNRLNIKTEHDEYRKILTEIYNARLKTNKESKIPEEKNSEVNNEVEATV